MSKAVFMQEDDPLKAMKKELDEVKKQRVEMAIEGKAKEHDINRLKALLNGKDDEVRLRFNKKEDESRPRAKVRKKDSDRGPLQLDPKWCTMAKIPKAKRSVKVSRFFAKPPHRRASNCSS